MSIVQSPKSVDHQDFGLSTLDFGLPLLRDGVTGNISGFELEDEGSTPSPAANLSNATRYFDEVRKW
jgi:hypothetical protein